MEFNNTAILFAIAAIVLCGLAIYFAILLWIKKTKGRTLQNQLKELYKQIQINKSKLRKLTEVLAETKTKLKQLIELEKNEESIRSNLSELTSKAEDLKNKIKQMETDKDELHSQISSIKEDLSIFEPKHSLVNLGFFEEPKYLFETSDRYKEEIKIIRNNQKELIKSNKCIKIPDSIAIISDSKYANKILKGQAALMIKAFNIECDNLLTTLKVSNYSNVLERIDKVATDIEKSALSLNCGFSKEYVELKFKECELQYQFKLKQTREQEEQAIIKEQMREEQKAIREFERALAKAEKEEEMYKNALVKARKELAISGDKNKDKLEARIILLEQKLAEAEENQKRAQSMAEQTRRGHVYIISNIGSFGEDIYKIGLTRRLEPLDRVKELGDASVPFSFDVHAMIYSEDAPALETSLHKEFSRFKVNQVNNRKEFFNVNLLEIQEKANQLVQGELDFKVTALAEEYYESLKLRESIVDVEQS